MDIFDNSSNLVDRLWGFAFDEFEKEFGFVYDREIQRQI